MDFIAIAFPAVFVVLAAAAIPAMGWILRRLHENMRRIASELGLSYRGPLEASAPDGAASGQGARRFLRLLEPWRMVGNLSGVFVTVSPESKGKQRYSVAEAHFPRPLPFTMLIGRETAFTKLGMAVLRQEDILSGDAQFDTEARVRGSDGPRIAALLGDQRVRESILAALRVSRAITISEKGASWQQQGLVEDAKRYREALDLLLPIVQALQAAGCFRPGAP
jgi:hypothetical protein